MRVGAIAYRVHESPRTEPFMIASGSSTSATNVIVRMEGGNLVGYGNACPNSVTKETRDTIRKALDVLTSALRGREFQTGVEFADAMDAAVADNPAAKAGLDIAFHDVRAQERNVPLFRFLGGGSRDRMRTDMTIGIMELDATVAKARHWVAQGFRALKLKVGIEPAADIRRVRAVREAVGDRVELMIDANYLFAFSQALDLCRRIEGYNITWFEEPVYGNDARLLANLRRQTRIPIAAGQNEGHKWRHRELLVHDAVDVIQPNVVWVGGYTEALKVAAMAQAFNIPIANGGGWPHHNMHLIAGVSNGWRVEFHLVMWRLGEAIFQDPPKPVRGMVTLPDRPGLGLEPKEEMLSETRES